MHVALLKVAKFPSIISVPPAIYVSASFPTGCRLLDVRQRGTAWFLNTSDVIRMYSLFGS